MKNNKDTEDGPTAFPITRPGYETLGMTLRDYFAAAAMAAYIAKIPLQDSEGILGKQTTREDNTRLQQDIAESAYWAADAMLSARAANHKTPYEDNDE